MKYQTRVHIAGEAEGLVQRCLRCGAILTDYRGAAGIGEWHPCWWSGYVGVTELADGTKLNPTCMVQMDHDAREVDEVGCLGLIQ